MWESQGEVHNGRMGHFDLPASTEGQQWHDAAIPAFEESGPLRRPFQTMGRGEETTKRILYCQK